jgi:recombinational DNA repair protein RecR
MKERTEPCKQCGNFDYYYKGDFSYCRFCHNEASKRYNQRISVQETQKLPKRDLEYLISPDGRRGSAERAKLSCPQGHPYSGDNLRTNINKKTKINRKCRACDRNRKRVLYGLEPEPAYKKLSDMLDTDVDSM